MKPSICTHCVDDGDEVESPTPVADVLDAKEVDAFARELGECASRLRHAVLSLGHDERLAHVRRLLDPLTDSGLLHFQ